MWDRAMDGEAGTTVADRSTAAVGVASEGGATSDGTTTHDQTSALPDGAVATNAPTPTPQPDRTAEPAADRSLEPGGTAEQTLRLAEPAVDAGIGAGAAAGPDAATEALAAEPETTVLMAAPEAATDDRAAGTVGRKRGGQDGPKARGTAPEAAGAAVPAVAAPTPAEAATEPLPAASVAGTANTANTTNTAPTAATRRPKAAVTAPELHSGHKLARRYQLEECVTRVDGFSSWRAVDEKLRRAVGIHVLPAEHPRARQVLAAARSAALLGDPRFVQVLDAVEDDELVYVIHEWLPDATSLADLLTTGPLEPHEAYQMVSQVSQGMAAAHREGLAHLRLDPGDVLRTVSGQYRIRGLAVAAALRGLGSDRPQRKDTESIGALLYAALTQRWPYEEDAHGLAGLPKGVGLLAPDQVRAGIHRGLSEIAMRALVNDGATASREEPPCTTPEELAKAVAAVPRIRPPEHPPPVYRPTAFQQPAPPPAGGGRPGVVAPAPPPALPGRTGQALKWAVAALLIVAIGLGSWQLADTLQSRENQPNKNPAPTGRAGGKKPAPAPAVRLRIADAKDFDPLGDGSENPGSVFKVHDGDPSTYWDTRWYASADLGGLKKGVGVIVDLGSAKSVSKVTVDFLGDTSVQLLAASQDTSAMPTGLSAFTSVASGSGTDVSLTPKSKVTTRYLLVWLTRLPVNSDGKYRGKVSEIHVMG
jgi:hypothetical protein